MDRPTLIASEHKNQPILIIDKPGHIGLALLAKLKDYLQAVFVSELEPEDKTNLLYLRYGRKIPEIPQDKYSHIFFIAESAEELEDFYTNLSAKAHEDKTRFAVIVNKIDATFKDEPPFAFEKGSLWFILGDLFGGQIVNKPKSRIEKMFLLAKKTKQLNLPNMGLKKIFPIAFDDAIIEILKVSFGNPLGNVFFLFPQEGITELGIAHGLQKIDPLLKIDFRKEEKLEKEREEHLPVGENLLASTYPVMEKIQNAYTTFLLPGGEVSEDFWQERTDYHGKKSSRIKTAFALSMLFFVSLILLPFLSTLLLVLMGSGSLFLVGKEMKANDFSATWPIVLSRNAFFLANQTGEIMQQELGLIKQEDLVSSAMGSLNALYQISDGAKILLEEQGNLRGILEKKEFDSETLTQEDISKSKIAFIEFQKGMQANGIPDSIKLLLKKKMDEFSPIINVADAIPAMLGFDKEKSYLLLFQNNMELRPGGGFIGSYATANVYRGQLKSFAINDVYNADGLLKGHIEPPFPIRRYIPQVHLYLRDSNFNVDFQKNAFMAALLFQQETGEKIDGVIAIDLSFVKELLGVIGPVYVAQYQQTVTADNFFLLTENHAEKNSFPGSSQKKDFLRSFFDSLQVKLQTKNKEYSQLASVVLQSLLQKHIQLAFNNLALEDMILANKFASSMWDSREIDNSHINDVLGVNEANIGVNKVNYFITRTIDQKVTLSDSGELHSALTATYTNEDKNGAWPGGPYKNYVRFLLPATDEIKAITINNIPQQIVPAVTDPVDYEAKGFVAPQGLEVEKTEEDGKVLYGFLLQVDPGETKAVNVEYASSQKIDMSLPVLDYSQWYIKQPGTDEYPYSFVFSYPSSYNVLDAKELVNKNGTEAFSNVINEDKLFSIRLGKK